MSKDDYSKSSGDSGEMPEPLKTVSMELECINGYGCGIIRLPPGYSTQKVHVSIVSPASNESGKVIVIVGRQRIHFDMPCLDKQVILLDPVESDIPVAATWSAGVDQPPGDSYYTANIEVECRLKE